MLFADCPSLDKRRQKIKAFYRTQACVSNLLKRFTYAARVFRSKLSSKYYLFSAATLYAHLNRKPRPPQSNAISKFESAFQENAEEKTGNAQDATTYRSDIALCRDAILKRDKRRAAATKRPALQDMVRRRNKRHSHYTFVP